MRWFGPACKSVNHHIRAESKGSLGRGIEAITWSGRRPPFPAVVTARTLFLLALDLLSHFKKRIEVATISAAFT